MGHFPGTKREKRIKGGFMTTMWYAAHVIMYFKRKQSSQRIYLVWENVFLIKAKTHEQAFKKSIAIGRSEEDTSDDLRWNDKPAALLFGGVRKLVECQDGQKPGSRPVDGTELTYSQLIVKGKESLEKLIGGESAPVFCLD
jgi:hypothetical protein